jgi:hypothetical protein
MGEEVTIVFTDVMIIESRGMTDAKLAERTCVLNTGEEATVVHASASYIIK